MVYGRALGIRGPCRPIDRVQPDAIKYVRDGISFDLNLTE